MSISGSRLRTSTAIQAVITSSPAASNRSVLADPQPHVVVSETATSTAHMPTLISVAAVQFTRPGSLIGDSGTKRHVHAAAIRVVASGIQNSQW